MKKLSILILFLFCFLSLTAQITETIHVQDAAHKTSFSMDLNPDYSSILFTVYKNGKSICADGNVKIYVDFKERDSTGKRLTFDGYNQWKFNCKGYYSFHVTADSLSNADLFERYNMLTTKNVYAIIFEPYSNTQVDLVRVNVDAKSALLIQKSVKKYIGKSK